MERRDFLWQAGLLAAAGLLPLPTTGAPGPGDPSPLQPVLVPALPPLSPNGGMDIRVRVRSAMTNGLFSSVECAVAPKLMGPPPHYHQELDEVMFVLAGTATVLVGDDVVEVPAGGWHLRPRRLPHTFWNATAEPLHFVDMYFHQPFEEYLERIFHELTPANGFPDGSAAKQQQIDALNQRFGVVFGPTAGAQRQALVAKYGLK